MQRWQFAVQRQLARTSLVEVAYAGNRGTRLQVNREFNAVPEQYLSKLATRDQDVINLLGAQEANPYYPLPPRTNLASTTVPRNQLPRPYPQFTSVTANQNIGHTWYHSAQVRVERRFSKHVVEDHGCARLPQRHGPVSGRGDLQPGPSAPRDADVVV